MSDFIKDVDYFECFGGYELKKKQIHNCKINGFDYDDAFVSIKSNGDIILFPGYWWNGDNVVADSVLKASAFHDAGYYLYELEVIDDSWKNRRKLDKMYYKLNRAGGMGCIRANIRLFGVRGFGWAFC